MTQNTQQSVVIVYGQTIDLSLVQMMRSQGFVVRIPDYKVNLGDSCIIKIILLYSPSDDLNTNEYGLIHGDRK